MGIIWSKIFPPKEDNSAAVKKQAEGASNPMYALASLVSPNNNQYFSLKSILFPPDWDRYSVWDVQESDDIKELQGAWWGNQAKASTLPIQWGTRSAIQTSVLFSYVWGRSLQIITSTSPSPKSKPKRRVKFGLRTVTKSHTTTPPPHNF